jgi:nitrogen fixation protein FixH
MIIIGMLFAHVLLMMTCVVIVLQRPGESAIISDYYNKAQAYDYYKQQLTASQKLGWKTDLEQTDQTDGLGHRRMTLSLSDSKNQPLAGATVNVHCFHWSHGDEAKTLTASATASGQYNFALPAKYMGFWQFDITAQSGNRTFIQTVTQFIN